MMCLCGHGESCYYCDSSGIAERISYNDKIKQLEKKVKQFERIFEDIFKSADDAIAEPNTGAKAMMSFRWIKKLAMRGLGELDD